MVFISGFDRLWTGMYGLAPLATVGALFLFFLKAGAFVFGSGLASVPFLYGGVVEKFHWLTEQQFVDAVAVAMITPGPVLITAAFIGYLVAGPVGAFVAAGAVFAPPYFIVIVAAPYYRRFAQNRQVKASSRALQRRPWALSPGPPTFWRVVLWSICQRCSSGLLPSPS